MSINLYREPSVPFTAKLDGRFTSTDATMVLDNTEGLQIPGVVVVDRIDLTTDLASSKKEFCSYTGISGQTLTGLSRGLAGTTAVDHNSGALVECYFSVSHWTDLRNYLLVEHTSATGVHPFNIHARSIQFTGVSGASGLKGDVVIVPSTNMSIKAVSGASGYNFVEIDAGGKYYFPLLTTTSSSAGANKIQVIAEKSVTLKSISFALKTPSSAATLILDINKNGTSIFIDQNMRPMLGIGGTYASTASIGTLNITKGDIISLDVDQ